MPTSPAYLILFNLSKEINVGHLVRSANAFGADVVFVGRKDWSRVGAVGRTRRKTRWEHFFTLDDAVAELRRRGCQIVGIEIADQAKSVWDAEFVGPTAFLAGNEGEGLTAKHMQLCDELVYVPQYGTAVSLNVNVATSIVLHHFARQAGISECSKDGSKFMSNESG